MTMKAVEIILMWWRRIKMSMKCGIIIEICHLKWSGTSHIPIFHQRRRSLLSTQKPIEYTWEYVAAQSPSGQGGTSQHSLHWKLHPGTWQPWSSEHTWQYSSINFKHCSSVQGINGALQQSSTVDVAQQSGSVPGGWSQTTILGSGVDGGGRVCRLRLAPNNDILALI